MVTYGLFKVILAIAKFFFGWVYLPDFGLTTTFATYITWFNTFIDSALSLFAFLIPRPVFVSAVTIFLIIHEFEHFIELLNFVLSKFPSLSGWRNS